jgi:hypothetical protein
MNLTRSLFIAGALLASVGTSAAAQVTGSTTSDPIGPFLSLSAPGACTTAAPCTLGGIGSIEGGTVFASDQPFADIPAGAVFGGRFLSAGPTSTEPSVISFSGGLPSIGFLWGSPDTYNRLYVEYGGFATGSSMFTASGLGFSETGGDQSFSQYVRFDADAGYSITGLRFLNDPSTNAFEVANFSVAVPEPSSLGLLAVGLGMLGLASRRRRYA